MDLPTAFQERAKPIKTKHQGKYQKYILKVKLVMHVL